MREPGEPDAGASERARARNGAAGNVRSIARAVNPTNVGGELAAFSDRRGRRCGAGAGAEQIADRFHQQRRQSDFSPAVGRLAGTVVHDGAWDAYVFAVRDCSCVASSKIGPGICDERRRAGKHRGATRASVEARIGGFAGGAFAGAAGGGAAVRANVPKFGVGERGTAARRRAGGGFRLFALEDAGGAAARI